MQPVLRSRSRLALALGSCRCRLGVAADAVGRLERRRLHHGQGVAAPIAARRTEAPGAVRALGELGLRRERGGLPLGEQLAAQGGVLPLALGVGRLVGGWGYG